MHRSAGPCVPSCPMWNSLTSHSVKVFKYSNAFLVPGLTCSMAALSLLLQYLYDPVSTTLCKSLILLLSNIGTPPPLYWLSCFPLRYNPALIFSWTRDEMVSSVTPW